MLDAGAIEGEDMLPEVALVKLMWVLANRPDEVHSLMKTPLAGEIGFSTPITV
jgi:glutamyl-tRNA(Gln) amidotransferase subunit D